MRHDAPLESLAPQWLPREKTPWGDGYPGARYQMALSVLCPFNTGHRHELWLRAPLDGGPPVVTSPLYELEGYPAKPIEGVPPSPGGIDLWRDVTLYVRGDDAAPIRIGCGDFWIAGGTVLFHTD